MKPELSLVSISQNSQTVSSIEEIEGIDLEYFDLSQHPDYIELTPDDICRLYGFDFTNYEYGLIISWKPEANPFHKNRLPNGEKEKTNDTTSI